MIANRESLAERVAEQIGERLLTPARTGRRLAAVRELAADLGVSVTTVRAAQMLLAKKGLVEIRHGSGCYVSRPESTVPKRHIAILSEYNFLLSPRGVAFHSRVMNELRLFLETKRQSSRLYIGHVMSEQPSSDTATCSGFLEDLALDRISGIAALATLPLFKWTDQARTKGIPIVGMNGLHYRFNGAVDPDFAGAIHSSVQRLVGNGRRHPAFIGWNNDSCALFSAVVAGMGLTPNPRWTRISLPPSEPGAGWSDFREIWTCGEERPDSVIFSDDVLFQDALPAIQACGVRVPAELEVVVLANKGIVLPRPFPYTRLDCDPSEFAEEMGKLLLQLMAGEKPVRRQLAIPYRPATDDETQEDVELEIELAHVSENPR